MDLVTNIPFHIWMIACLLTAAVASFLFYARKVLLKNLSAQQVSFRFLQRYPFLEVFSQTKNFFLVILSIYLGTKLLLLPESVTLLFSRIFITALALQLGFWANEAILFGLKNSRLICGNDGSPVFGSVTVVQLLAKLIVWSLIAVFLLGNLGFDITALVAGLGVGGIAVALAAQNILSDLFASLSIVVDQPFALGDFIMVDEFKGHVEQIGLKTTRIRSVSGEELIFSNADLLKSRLRNYKRMEKRRVEFSLEISSDTPLAKVKKMGSLVRECFSDLSDLSLERVCFRKIGEAGYQFEIIYNVPSREMGVYLEYQQQLNYALLEKLEREGIALASPSTTVYLQQAKG